jgi:hypothetical protein
MMHVSSLPRGDASNGSTETMLSIHSAICGAPLWWLWVSYVAGHWWWSALVKAQSYEVTAAVCCLVAYLYAKRPTSTRDAALLLLAHYAFWFRQFRFLFRELIRGWGGSVALLPVIGLLAGLIWVRYVSQLHCGLRSRIRN